ncbi:hypothetical protein JRQ81_003014, partial [Phrynocephalus forsythii]
MVEGYGKEKGTKKDNRCPITPEILKHLDVQWQHVCRDVYEQALLVAYFAALRITDASISQGKWTLSICKSKTIQTGKGALIELGPCLVTEICPAAATQQFLQLRGEAKGYLFCHRDGSPLTKSPVLENHLRSAAEGGTPECALRHTLFALGHPQLQQPLAMIGWESKTLAAGNPIDT